MKRIIITLAIAAILVACNCPKNQQCEAGTPATQTPTMAMPEVKQPIELIGKQALLTYPTLKAEVQYLSPTQIHWKTTDDKGQVAEQTNPLTLKAISSTQYFLSWVEDDGTSVSQVIDTEKGTVTAFLTYADEKGKRLSQFLEGTFQLQ